jgi:hypothetical protein
VTAAAVPLLLAVLSTPATPVPPGGTTALTPVPRGRWHFEAGGPPRVRWSVLFRRNETGDETFLLVEAPGGRFVLTSTQPPAGSGTREEVTIPAVGESVSRTLAPFPSPGVAECAPVRPPDACVVLEGSRGRLAAPLSRFSGEEAEALRQRAAALVSPAFLERLKGLAPALPVTDLAFYSEDFLAFLDSSLARPRGPDLVGRRLPGCAFDATFGHPCTAEEDRREEWLFRRTPAPAPR